MPTKAELEEENARLREERDYAHAVAVKLAADFRLAEKMLLTIEGVLENLKEKRG